MITLTAAKLSCSFHTLKPIADGVAPAQPATASTTVVEVLAGTPAVNVLQSTAQVAKPLRTAPQKLDTHPTFGVFFMAKYNERFKLQVVQEYLAGPELGLQGDRGRQYGIGR